MSATKQGKTKKQKKREKNLTQLPILHKRKPRRRQSQLSGRQQLLLNGNNSGVRIPDLAHGHVAEPRERGESTPFSFARFGIHVDNGLQFGQAQAAGSRSALGFSFADPVAWPSQGKIREAFIVGVCCDEDLGGVGDGNLL